MGSQSARPAADRFLVQQFVYVLGHSSHIEINKLAFQFLTTVQDLGIIVVFPLFPEIPLSLGSLPIILDPLSQSFCPALSPPSSLRQWVSSLLILPPHHPCWGPPGLCFQRRALSRTPSRISGCLSAASRGTSGGALDLLCPCPRPQCHVRFPHRPFLRQVPYHLSLGRRPTRHPASRLAAFQFFVLRFRFFRDF